jgi:hypothetical protein
MCGLPGEAGMEIAVTFVAGFTAAVVLALTLLALTCRHVSAVEPKLFVAQPDQPDIPNASALDKNRFESDVSDAHVEKAAKALAPRL